MFESEGTTPEFQGNPESGIDQFLNRSTTPEPTYEELKARVAQLTETLAQANQRISDEMDRVGRLISNNNKAERAFKDILDGDIEASNIVETYGEVLAEHLGWEFTREVTVTITATWRRETVLVSYGHELSPDDFEIDIKGFGDVEFTSYASVDTIEIDEH